MRAISNLPRRLLLSLALSAGLGATHAQTNPAPFTTGYWYDANARLVGTIRPSSNGTSGPFLASRNIYNSQGLVDHEDQGYLSAWQSQAGPSVLPSAWSGFTIVQSVYYTYDTSGRKLTETTKSGGTSYTLTQYNYDSQGRVWCTAQRMNPAAFGSLPDACSLGPQGTQGPDRITQTTYDPLGRPTLIQKALLTPIAYTYAAYAYYVGGQQNVYDSNGNVVVSFNLAGPVQGVTDANGNYTYYQYDSLARLQYQYFPSPTSKGNYNQNDYEQYGYDLKGRRTSLRKRDANIIRYDFDALDRQIDEIYPAGTIQNVYTDYDLRGLQLYASFGSISGPGLIQTYDGFGRLQTASTNQSGPTLSLSYQYDAEGNRTRITHPDSSYFQYAYDGLNRLSTIKENGATTVITQTYDSAGRRWTLQRGANVSSTTYLYDSISRLQTLSQDLQGTNYDESRTFGYNPASQVVTRTLTSTVYSYTQAPTVATTYQVNGLNQYTQLTSGSTVAPIYDLNGNMKSDGSTAFSYDVLNRMISASGPKTSGLTVALSYDPKGRLFQTSGGASGTTQFLYDGDALVAEYNAAGALLRRYVHGEGMDKPLVTYEGSSVGAANRRYFHVDTQGSVIVMADSTGNGTQPNTYDPYGVPGTGNSGRFQYTGQIILPDLGQYYYKARIYNPTIGRFMQTDPIGYKDDLDVYSYVGEDPLNKTDATGLLACQDEVYPSCQLWQTAGTVAGASNAAAERSLGARFVSSVTRAVGLATEGLGLTFAVVASAVTLSGDTDEASRSDRNRWLPFFHGTDRATAVALLGGAPISVEAATAVHIDGAIGFYLTDSNVAAEFFARRRHTAANPGAILPFGMTVSAFRALQGMGAIFQPIPQGTGGHIPGQELYVPPTAFAAFEQLRHEGLIKP